MWKEFKLGEIFTFKNGINKGKESFGAGIPIVNYSDVFKSNVINGSELTGRVEATNNEMKLFQVLDGDVFFTRTSETLEEIGISSVIENVSENTVFSGFILRAREKQQILSKNFKRYCFSSYSVRKQIIQNSSISTRALTSGAILSKVKIQVPSIEEQEKISIILMAVDNKIELIDKSIDLLKEKKDSISNSIFSGRIDKNKHVFSQIGKHIFNVSNLNKNNEVLNVLSISNVHGFIKQNEQFSKNIASLNTSSYKIVKKGYFAYNPSRINVGSVGYLTEMEEGIISPMYITFKNKPTIIDKYLYHYMKSKRFLKLVPLFTEGSVRDSLSFKQLSAMKIYYPSLDDQIKYAKLLDWIDNKLELLTNYKMEIKNQKYGLMQQLLTGKIRVS